MNLYINTSPVKLTVKDFRTAFEKRRNRNLHQIYQGIGASEQLQDFLNGD